MDEKARQMTYTESDKLIVGCCETFENALEYIHIKKLSGWKVLVPPFVNKQTMADSGEDTTVAVPSEWTFVLHRF